MKRRDFLISTGALIATSQMNTIASPPGDDDDHRARTIDRLNVTVWDRDRTSEFGITGWKVTVGEQISWDTFAWNPGPKAIKIGYVKPDGISHPWQWIAEFYIHPGESRKLIMRGKPENEDFFFYALIFNRAPDIYTIVDGNQGNSNGGIHDNSRVVHMSWTRPQEIHLEMRPTPGQNVPGRRAGDAARRVS